MPSLPPGDLPDPRIEPASRGCPVSAGRFLTTQSPGNLVRNIKEIKKVYDSCGFQRRDYDILSLDVRPRIRAFVPRRKTRATQ